MHILIVHQAFCGPNDPGGTRHFEFARHLVRAGFIVTIVASDVSYLTGGRQATGLGATGGEVFGGVRVMRAWTLSALHRSFIWRVVSFFSFMVTSVIVAVRAPRPDVVMGTSPPIFQAVSAWAVAVLRRRPFLLEIRDLWPEFAIDMGVLRSPVLIHLSRWLERFLYGRADHLLVNSPAYRDYLLGKGIASERISLVANGADPGMFDPDARGLDFRQRWDLGERFVVTYAGALGLANDIPTLLRAAARLRDDDGIRIALVGDGKERLALGHMAAAMGLRNVIFTGAVAKAEMANVLAASDATIAILQDIPMFRTTYPNKVFDSMAAGRPVVLAIDGVIREVVERAGAGVFVPPGDDEALAEAIQSLAAAPAEARAMGARGRAEVIVRFNRHSQAEEFRELVHFMASRDRA